MGGSSSRRTTETRRTVDRDSYLESHPGLSNRSSRRMESEITDNVNSPDPNDKIAIKIQGVDLNGFTNTAAHHTDGYEGSMSRTLIVRRGQEFELDIEFNREYDESRDAVRLVFTFGKKDMVGRRNHIEVPLSDRSHKKEWKANVQEKRGNSIKVGVTSPPRCYVGRWALNIDVERSENGHFSVERNKHLVDIIMLFNPWSKDDQVYMSEVEKLSEYVLNDTGRIWTGSHIKPSSIPWEFGQFEEFDDRIVKGTVLDCALYLLDRADMAESLRGDPVLICRKISAQSAHDTDMSITIDTYYSEDDMPEIDRWNKDSVWNFHVWNDVWMARPDLPPGYGGWQAIDATPQETSEGVYCLGPAPLQAIKKGEVYQNYDCAFVFAEVNADEIDWLLTRECRFKVIKWQPKSIGKRLSTKEWNSSYAEENVTQQYKFKEGSAEEAAAITQANLYSSYPGLYQDDIKDVEFSLTMNPDTFVGDTVKLELSILNKGRDERTIEGRITVSSIYYTGVTADTVAKRQVGQVTLKPNDSYVEELEVSERDYYDHLKDHCNLKVSILCIVNETGQTYSQLEKLRLRKPHLDVKGPKTGRVGEKFKIEVSFVNPLSMTMTRCRMRVDAPGMGKPALYKYSRVDARDRFSETYELTPLKKGKREIVLNFSSDQLLCINGSFEITIE